MAKSKHRRIPTNGAERYVVSEINPNEHCGGHCACGRKPHDQGGPYIVFPGEVIADGKFRVRPVVCAPCAKAAVLAIERGDEVSVVGAGSLSDADFDGGVPDQPEDYLQLKARYESEVAGTPLAHIPTFADWLAARDSEVSNQPGAVTTGIDPNATSLVQARADTSPVGTRGDRTPVGRTDDPAAQLSNPDNWGTPEDPKVPPAVVSE
jgi:hypothetical protein